MTTERWMQIPAMTFVISDLVPTQELDTFSVIKADCADPLIHVVLVDGVLLVEDGHGRLARAMARGDMTIEGRLLRPLGVGAQTPTCEGLGASIHAQMA